MTRPALLALTLLVAVATARAQTDGPKIVRTTAVRFLASAATTSAGSGFRVIEEPTTGNPSFIYGGRFAIAPAPRGASDYEFAARALVAQFPELFGCATTELELEGVKLLPLSRIGSSDKVVALFRQVIDGVPVLESTLSFLFDARNGSLLAIDTQAVPGAIDVPLVPRSTGSEAIAAASVAFATRFGVQPSEVRSLDAAIVGPSARFDASTGVPDRGPTLVYRVVLANPVVMSEGAPADAEVIVSAEGDLAVFRLERLSHAAIDGSVKGNVNTGAEPNSATNQEQPGLEYVYLKDAANNQVVATTDASGNFSIASDAPFAGFVELQGPYARVTNSQGASARIDVAFAGPGTFAPLFNPSKAEFTSAETAAFYWTNKFRDWVKSVDPTETEMDFQVKANVNLADTCNAYFSGNSINFFAAGGSCTNTAFRSVCHHEEGHFANERFNGAVSGAFHEGVADAWAYYINDDPCLQAFSFSGGCLRNGEQTSVKKCPKDADEACHGGEPHEEGKSIASALWAVRKNIKTAVGAGPGSAAANALFLAWFQAYNDRKILNVINHHWIALDDDNGTLLDFTPHFAAINTGFQSYSWPTYVIPDLAIDVVTGPANNGSVAPGVPATITADLSSLMGSVVARELRWSADGGANWSTVVMTSTGNPNQYTATIPAQTQDKRIRWYVRSVGSFNGNVLTEPKNAPADSNVYAVGFFFELGSYGFDALSDEGFTHVNLTGTNGDQWVRGNPATPGSNEATDPDFAYSGNFVFGTDLSTDGSSDGKYEPSSSGELRTPIIDCSGSSNVILQFRRQLAVDKFTSDQATVRVNGTIVWQNSSATSTIDTAWTLQEIDITALAANNPSVQVSWRILANGSTEFGGWNVDDVVLYRVDPPYPSYFEKYGEGCIGSWGVAPTLSGKGPPSPGQSITLKITGGLPFNQVFLFVATAPGLVHLPGGCDYLLGGAIVVAGLPILASLDGTQSLPITIPPTAGAGDAYLQFFANDPGGLNDQYTISNGLHIHIQ